MSSPRRSPRRPVFVYRALERGCAPIAQPAPRAQGANRPEAGTTTDVMQQATNERVAMSDAATATRYAAGRRRGRRRRPDAPRCGRCCRCCPSPCATRAASLAALVALVIASAATLVVPLAVRRMIDYGFSAEGADLIDRYFGDDDRASSPCSRWRVRARYYLVMTLGERVMADVRTAVFAHLTRLDPGFYDTVKSGEIVSRLTADTTQIKSAFGASASVALRNLVLFLGAVADDGDHQPAALRASCCSPSPSSCCRWWPPAGPCAERSRTRAGPARRRLRLRHRGRSARRASCRPSPPRRPTLARFSAAAEEAFEAVAGRRRGPAPSSPPSPSS